MDLLITLNMDTDAPIACYLTQVVRDLLIETVVPLDQTSKYLTQLVETISFTTDKLNEQYKEWKVLVLQSELSNLHDEANRLKGEEGILYTFQTEELVLDIMVRPNGMGILMEQDEKVSSNSSTSSTVELKVLLDEKAVWSYTASQSEWLDKGLRKSVAVTLTDRLIQEPSFRNSALCDKITDDISYSIARFNEEQMQNPQMQPTVIPFAIGAHKSVDLILSVINKQSIH